MEKLMEQVAKYGEVHEIKIGFSEYTHSDGRKGFSATVEHSNQGQALSHAREIASAINRSTNFQAFLQAKSVNVVQRNVIPAIEKKPR